jgi:hypothetical protein
VRQLVQLRAVVAGQRGVVALFSIWIGWFVFWGVGGVLGQGVKVVSYGSCLVTCSWFALYTCAYGGARVSVYVRTDRPYIPTHVPG